MSKMLRRFEVLLPLRLNDGTPVPDAAVADTLLELEQKFGAVSCETNRYADSGGTRANAIGMI